MMQSCASAAKLRGDGPILNRGSKAIVLFRVAATSVRHLQLGIDTTPSSRNSVGACLAGKVIAPKAEGADLP